MSAHSDPMANTMDTFGSELERPADIIRCSRDMLKGIDVNKKNTQYNVVGHVGAYDRLMDVIDSTRSITNFLVDNNRFALNSFRNDDDYNK